MRRLSLVSQSIYQISKNKYDNFGKILYLNGLLLLNISFGMAATSIIPEIASQMGYNSLGQIVVLLQYLMSMVSNIIAPSYLQKFTYKWSFFIHATQGLTQCLSGLFIAWAHVAGFGVAVTYCVSILIACLTGLFYGGLWVAQNLYISENSNDSNRAMFFGVSNSLSNSANMVGALVSAFLIAPLGPFYYFLILFFLTLGTQFLYLFVRQPPGHITEETPKEIEQELANNRTSRRKDNGSVQYDNGKNTEENEQPKQVRYFSEAIKNQTSLLHPDLDNAMSVIKRRERLEHEKKEYEVIELFHELPIKKQLAMIWEMASNPRLRPLMPYMFATGLVLGLEYGVYYKLISQAILHTYPADDSAEVQVKTFIVFFFQGLSEIFGGLTIGWLGEKLFINYASIIQSNLIQVVILVTFANCFILSYNVCLAFGLMWGFADCAGQANCMSLLSEDYGDDVRVFGLYNFLQNFGALTAIVISIFMGSQPFYIYMLILIGWMLFTNVSVNFYRRTLRVIEFNK